MVYGRGGTHARGRRAAEPVPRRGAVRGDRTLVLTWRESRCTCGRGGGWSSHGCGGCDRRRDGRPARPRVHVAAAALTSLTTGVRRFPASRLALLAGPNAFAVIDGHVHAREHATRAPETVFFPLTYTKPQPHIHTYANAHTSHPVRSDWYRW